MIAVQMTTARMRADDTMGFMEGPCCIWARYRWSMTKAALPVVVATKVMGRRVIQM